MAPSESSLDAKINGSGLTAQKVLLDPTGLTHVTDTNVQGAIGELDTAVGTATVASINDIGDVVAPTPADNDVLSYDAFTSNWVAVAGGGGGGGGDLAATLILGNITDGTDIVVTSGDAIRGQTAPAASNEDGKALVLSGGSPDGTGEIGPIQATTDGNLRGGGAVDLQQKRNAVTDVAAAPFSAIVGGTGNRITHNPDAASGGNTATTILGGFSNTITGDFARASAIVGGRNNTITGEGGSFFNSSSFMGGGYSNSIGRNSSNSAVFGAYNSISSPEYYGYAGFAAGRSNTIRSQTGYGGAYDAAVFGYSNLVQAGRSVAFGNSNQVHRVRSLVCGTGNRTYGADSIACGNGSRITADRSQAWGGRCLTHIPGQAAWSVSSAGALPHGAAQRCSYSLNRDTTNATAVRLVTSGTTPSTANQLEVTPGRAYGFLIIVTAYQYAGAAGTAGDSASWEIRGLIRRDLLGDTTLIGINPAGAAPLFSSAAAAGWEVTVTADNAQNVLAITIQGETDKTIRWHAAIHTSEAGNNT